VKILDFACQAAASRVGVRLAGRRPRGHGAGCGDGNGRLHGAEQARGCRSITGADSSPGRHLYEMLAGRRPSRELRGRGFERHPARGAADLQSAEGRPVRWPSSSWSGIALRRTARRASSRRATSLCPGCADRLHVGLAVGAPRPGKRMAGSRGRPPLARSPGREPRPGSPADRRTEDSYSRAGADGEKLYSFPSAALSRTAPDRPRRTGRTAGPALGRAPWIMTNQAAQRDARSGASLLVAGREGHRRSSPTASSSGFPPRAARCRPWRTPHGKRHAILVRDSNRPSAAPSRSPTSLRRRPPAIA